LATSIFLDNHAEIMITSRHNETVRKVRIMRKKRAPQRFLIEGPHLLEEALAARVSIETLLVSPRASGELVTRARSRAGEVLEVSDDVLSSVADSVHPQGIVAVGVVPERRPDPAALRGGRLVLLDEVRDPGNLGTVARTAWASGAAALLLVGHCVDPWNPKVVRAAAGATFRLPLVGLEGHDEAAAWLREHGQRAAMVVANGRVSCFEADLRGPITLVFGNEAHGVHPDTARFCQDSISIPMVEGCESLNLAASAAILCYLALDRNRVNPSSSASQPRSD
jgi:TrmH family RNA methyltransferase